MNLFPWLQMNKNRSLVFGANQWCKSKVRIRISKLPELHRPSDLLCRSFIVLWCSSCYQFQVIQESYASCWSSKASLAYALLPQCSAISGKFEKFTSQVEEFNVWHRHHIKRTLSFQGVSHRTKSCSLSFLVLWIWQVCGSSVSTRIRSGPHQL